MESNSPFKTCNVCKSVWETREDFLNDPSVSIHGYQVDFEELVAGIFLFTHTCGNTLAIVAEEFQDLHRGPVFETRATGTDICGSLCLREDCLEPCPAHCECAFVRDIIQVIKNWDKHDK